MFSLICQPSYNMEKELVTNKRINILKDIKNHADIMKKCALKSYLCYQEKMRFKKLLVFTRILCMISSRDETKIGVYTLFFN